MPLADTREREAAADDEPDEAFVSEAVLLGADLAEIHLALPIT